MIEEQVEGCDWRHQCERISGRANSLTSAQLRASLEAFFSKLLRQQSGLRRVPREVGLGHDHYQQQACETLAASPWALGSAVSPNIDALVETVFVMLAYLRGKYHFGTGMSVPALAGV
jgi:hypothetical protein